VWRELKEGSAIEVVFVTSDPALSHPAAWPQPAAPRWLGLPVAVALFAIAALLWLRVRRQEGLLSEGRPAPAIVTKHIRSKDGKYWKYAFALPGGSVQGGKSGPSRNPPAIGATLCILYDPDRPKRNAAYPLPLVRLDR
jgi:hypothetical protein